MEYERNSFDCFSHIKSDTLSKVALSISNHWVETVNATMEIDVQKTWGYKDLKTGNLSGMAGRVQRGEADIGGEKSFNFIESNF